MWGRVLGVGRRRLGSLNRAGTDNLNMVMNCHFGRQSLRAFEDRRLVSCLSKATRADGSGQRRSAERRHGAKLSRLTRVVPPGPALSHVRFFLGKGGTVKCGVRVSETSASSAEPCGMGTNNPAGRSYLVAPSRAQSHLVKPKKSKKTGADGRRFSRRTRRGRRKKR
jgi:hypothetical protein